MLVLSFAHLALYACPVLARLALYACLVLARLALYVCPVLAHLALYACLVLARLPLYACLVLARLALYVCLVLARLALYVCLVLCLSIPIWLLRLQSCSKFFGESFLTKPFCVGLWQFYITLPLPWFSCTHIQLLFNPQLFII